MGNFDDIIKEHYHKAFLNAENKLAYYGAILYSILSENQTNLYQINCKDFSVFVMSKSVICELSDKGFNQLKIIKKLDDKTD